MSKKVVAEIEIKLPITEYDIENIVASSFEGGSNTWLESTDNTTEEWEADPNSGPFAIWTVKMLLEGKTVNLYNYYDDEPLELTLDKLLAGIAMNHKERPHDCDLENFDSITADWITADCIMQYAFYNELIYG